MKAWVLHEIGEIRFEEVDKPKLTDNEVLVDVKAAGICGSDIPRIYKTGAHVHPLIPGHEFSGQVVQTGKNVDEKWMGKRVGIYPLIPCGCCIACQRQQYEMCRDYSYLGSRRDGGFAEYASVPEWNLIALPDNVTFKQAAMLEPMAVAVHAMRKAFSKDDTQFKSIAVCGLGTIGILLTMFLKEAGYSDIYVIANKDFQKKMAVNIGIDKGHIYNNKDSGVHEWLMAWTDGVGVDIFFECVGKNETVAEAVMDTAPNGTVQLVGNPFSDILLDKNTYWKILRNQLTVKGSWNSSFRHHKDDDWHNVLDRLENGRIHSDSIITHCLSIDGLEEGFLIMRDKAQEYLKVMMERE